jgi:hypothetical protein
MGQMPDRLASLPTAALAAILGAACLAVLAVAFVAGRMSAPSHATAATSLTAVRLDSTGISLPQLSQAVPLPALAAAPAVAPTTAPATPAVPVQHVQRTKPAHAGAPVDIVGSG